MLKKEIRKRYLAKRQLLGENEKKLLSQKIADQFLNWIPDSLFTVHIYLPIIEKHEIDTWPIIHELWKKGINTVVPAMNMSDTSLSSWVLTPETMLQENIWGVPEPQSAFMVDDGVIDLVVLPLLAFDELGFRVGYGKGFYDHFLASFDQQPLKVGLSFFEPVDRISDIHETDIPMEFCITPDETISF